MISPSTQSGFRLAFDWGLPVPPSPRRVRSRWSTLLQDCAGGREFTQYGYPRDVVIAAELDGSSRVPVLRDGVFRAVD